MNKGIIIFSAAALLLTLGSCRSEDDFTDSIFDTNIPAVDESKTTYPFDLWLYENFLVPYNVEVQYQFNFPASDMNFQLTPANYNKSQLLAHFIRYLFYDVYTKYAGDKFMKMYGPRIFHFIGSTGYSPTTGTEVLGTAAGGVKITLYNVNEIKSYAPGVVYTADDVDILNERIFHTMHHEFSHILHQTKSYPVTFGQVTSGSYDPITWQERDSVTTHHLGYVTHYASSANYEDFVETLSCIITETDHRWMNRIINACTVGLSVDKEKVLTLVDSLGIDVDAPGTPWNNITIYRTSKYDENTGEYVDLDEWCIAAHRSSERTVNVEQTAYVNLYQYTNPLTFTSFRDFLNWVPTSNDGLKPGINALLEKIRIATEWYTDRWGLHAFELRQEVRERQDSIDSYLHSDAVTIYDIK